MTPFFRSIYVTLLVALGTACAHAEYLPKAERVIDNVYAIVGPLGQRNPDNDGLNANFGFVVTPKGVILVDSGASRLGAQKIETAIRAVTGQPVRWVINTGSQDHRWLGNDHFARRGAEIIALRRTAATQAQIGAQQMQALERFLGERLAGTRPLSASKPIDGDTATLELGGETLQLRYTDSHFPGDAIVFLPKHSVVCTGDLVYVDRILGVMPESSVAKGQKAFRAMAALTPAHVVPGHGRVCDLAKAQRDTGDYYDFLADKIGAAAKELESMDEVLTRHADAPAFRHLEHFDSLHRANMNRAFTEFEAR
jgi:glyoxylase-like metal-dependent hydrolase (beta-lactamase superfamily II)